ncbi:NusA family KH domain protein [Methanosalsum zhilinae DSM 4017]|uniref:Probable transcription termination protein NusA n=1 Tax=Methanosalsum zhilinae (strain DSM 4017 / NBRC 107636 / OCM 62 / WeN5) TaxID=679901 RepID=F7XQ17_METZD|nr:NusA-like transcription termination signal-binding factor [Methanosalsum zhilinae]AEH60378.1 NusA family KH domain protein [Methanosalsum zhilinae DSM 4017]
MSEIKLTTEGIRYIALFEKETGASIRDCIVDNDRIIYVVNAGDMGAAIGRNGDHINKIKRAVDKHIELVEYSDDPVTFIKNAFGNVSIKSVKILPKKEKQLAYVETSNVDKGIAIGREGRNIEKVKILANRHHGIDDVVLQ